MRPIRHAFLQALSDFRSVTFDGWCKSPLAFDYSETGRTKCQLLVVPNAPCLITIIYEGMPKGMSGFWFKTLRKRFTSGKQGGQGVWAGRNQLRPLCLWYVYSPWC